MNRGGYELFSIRGVPVRLHRSFAIFLLILLLWTVAGRGSGRDILHELAAPILLFAVVIVHEIGHTLVALRLGVEVLDIRLTPLGGVARIARGRLEPRLEIAIAAAGPLVNVLFAALGLAIAVATDTSIPSARSMFLLDGGKVILTGGILEMFVAFNVLLGTLNLLPAFPVDGGRILRGLVALRLGRLRATRIACRLGSWSGAALIPVPLFIDGPQWWILPIMGILMILASLRERLAVELMEVSMFQPPPEASSPNVIDVEGKSRIIDDR